MRRELQESVASRRAERTLRMANRFLDEVRIGIAHAADGGQGAPPRLRSVHERAGHASPEYRTMGIPVEDADGGASPDVLSGAIARYTRAKAPDCLLLAIEAVRDGDDGIASPVLIAEARDTGGTRMYWVQPYRLAGRDVVWEEPVDGGWRDPGAEEMILDAGFGDAPEHRGRAS